MRAFVREFVEICCSILPFEDPVYEFGSFQVKGQEDLANLRPLFKSRMYIGTDMRKGKGVDEVMNLHDLPLPDESAGLALCLETLEHVENPVKAVNEIHRILKPKGILLLSTILAYPIHDYPSDYWRFTPACLEEIVLAPFKYNFIFPVGKEAFPNSILSISFKEASLVPVRFWSSLIEWQKRSSKLV